MGKTLTACRHFIILMMSDSSIRMLLHYSQSTYVIICGLSIRMKKFSLCGVYSFAPYRPCAGISNFTACMRHIAIP